MILPPHKSIIRQFVIFCVSAMLLLLVWAASENEELIRFLIAAVGSIYGLVKITAWHVKRYE